VVGLYTVFLMVRQVLAHPASGSDAA